MTISELAKLIILVCGVNSSNVDQDKVRECVDRMNNCMVTQNGEIKREKVQECISKR